MNPNRSIACGIALLLFGATQARASDRILRAEITVNAPVAQVYKAWTTDEGIATFFAPKGRVDLRVDGTYDVWFNPAGKPGERGAEGMRILDVEPGRRFAFTWNAPPSIPAIRGKRTVIILDFEPAGDHATKLRFTELGWGDGPDWDKAYDYFDNAWRSIVLPLLVYRFDKGPVDWSHTPEVPPVAPTLKTTLGAVRS